MSAPNPDSAQPRICVVGLGKLGACMAAAFASRGLKTIGVDLRAEPVAVVNAGRAPVDEPGLAELIETAGPRLRATTHLDDAIQSSDVTFVVVPTPSNADDLFSLRYVTSAIRGIGASLAKCADYHLVVVTSTVLPGSTELAVLPLLEQSSGKRCGRDFGLCYSPEFIALGSVIRDFLNPDLLLIGEYDERAGATLERVYAPLFATPPPSAHMSLVNAELTKIALNSYVTTKITFANLLAELCERLPGGDVDTVTAALGLDRRIGARYLRGALGFGGPCFPRDNLAFARLIEALDVEATLPQEVHDFNQRQAPRISRRIEQLLTLEQRRVGILGLAYKQDTNVIDASQGIAIAADLAASGCEVVVWDPKALDPARSVLGDRVRYAASGQLCIEEVDLVLVATPWPEFAHYDYSPSHLPLVIDPWRIIIKRPARWTALGLGSNDEETSERVRRLVRGIIATDQSS